MAKDWKSELKDIIVTNQRQIKQVIDDREKREKERLKKIVEIKGLIKPRMEFIKEIFEKDDYLGPRDSGEPEDSMGVTAAGQGQNQIQVQGVSHHDVIETEFIDSARRGERVAIPTIKEDTAELVMVMPALTDVNRLDLLYKIEFKEEKPVLHCYNLLSQGKMENNGSAHDKFEDFVQDTIKRFLLSWFMRKEGTELDKERKFELHIYSHGIKP